MYLKTLALVLRVSDYNDRDALLTLLTREHGKVVAKARGLRRKNSPLAAPCQLLSLCEMTLFEYRGMYTINEAHPIELFTNLRSDLMKLTLGSYFAQVSEVISQEDAPDSALQSLVLNCLFALSEMNIPEQKIKAVFDLRIASIAGYTPELMGCAHCGEEQPVCFDLSGGILLCEGCKHNHVGIRQPVTSGVLEAMRYIVYCDPKKLFAFSLGDSGIEQLAAIAEAYLMTQLERGFSTLDFYKSLLI